MLCIKADAAAVSPRLSNADDDKDGGSPSSFVVPLNTIGNSIIHRCIRKGKRKGGWKSRFSISDGASETTSISLSNETGTSSSGLELEQDAKSSGRGIGKGKCGKMGIHRSRLEQEIKTLQKQLREEIDLHLALTRASGNSAFSVSKPLCLPHKAQDILADIDVLEITISRLEEESVALQFQLSQERNERRLVQYRLRHLPASPSLTCSPASSTEMVTRPTMENRGVMTLDDLLVQTDVIESYKESCLEKFVQQPNQLSEEMVRCMRNILLCISDSSQFSPSESIASPQSKHSYSTMLSDSSSISPSRQSPSFDLEHGIMDLENCFDPYQVQGKLKWAKYIGAYSRAAEVSRMAVGEKQLQYAADALKRFRLLVEQLAKLNPACMNNNERLAFWINLYNTLIMHGYLAYGVPGSDVKFFSLMKKAAYTVGGLSLCALDIEHIILKMKPSPHHRPQLVSPHKFKLLEEKGEYAIDRPEPLVAFALSCGMHSSPAVRIFRPENVMDELQSSMRDYIQASVGISSKGGKLLVPKLLHCYTKSEGKVEDSMLPEWICRLLCPEQAAMVRDCSVPSRKQRLTSPRSFTVQSFDSTFRYLFLPDATSDV
ncbi:hypothetical protein ACHQM5_029632 [Ranunculus cassubicifolius]